MVRVLFFILYLVLTFAHCVLAQSEVNQQHMILRRTTTPATSPKTQVINPNQIILRNVTQPTDAEPIEDVASQTQRASLKYPNHGLATAGSSSVELSGKTFPLTYIKGCDRTHSIGFKFFLEKGLSCDFSARIHPHAVEFLKQNLHICAEAGLKAIGNRGTIARVDIHSQGVFVKRRVDNNPRKPWSNHSLGAAIDMNNLEIEFADGTKEIYPVAAENLRGRVNPGFTRCRKNCKGQRYSRTGRAKFYDGFYACMENKIEGIKAKGPKCSGGVLGCDYNSDHANHIHLSVPICPSPRGVATI